MYFASMASVGLKDVFIFFRLGGVSPVVLRHKGESEVLGLGNILRRTAGVSVAFAKIFERDFDFFFSYLVALMESVSGVSLVEMAVGCIPCLGTFGVPFAMLAIA